MKLLTLNLANYDDHSFWEKRIELISKIIINNIPDVIALQEVRFNPDEPKTRDSYQSMSEQILYYLNKQYKKYLGARLFTQPTMFYNSMLNDNHKDYRYYPLLKNENNDGEEWEGKSIISCYDVIEVGTRFLTCINKNDKNIRSTQVATLRTDKNKVVRVFNCHFSYDKENCCLNLRETIDFMRPYLNQCPCLLVGDFNCSPDKEIFEPLYDLGFIDAWVEKGAGEGKTSPSNNPGERIDYIWVNKLAGSSAIKSIRLVGFEPEEGIYASDHLGVFAEILI